ncbi:MAG TPA: xylulokinase [Bryobacteraceae bacterium]|nr:xylulokinase [Bryobacteraceae bacterium]
MYWLGLDVGTGGSRALLIDEKARVRFSFISPHEEMKMLKPLWAEQDPDNWWHASQIAIRGVLKEAGINGSSIAGIGLTGQMHGLVLLDAAQRVLRPALIWCDQRSQQQVDEINAKLGPENILRATANPVLTGFTLPKLLWVRDHEPDLFSRVRHVLLPKDYLRFRLTGDFASDVSDASGTSLFDVLHRKWSHEMINGLDLDHSWLPKVYESSDVTGAVSQTAGHSTGLSAGTPVVGGAGDQAASAVGNGIVEPGNVSCTIGSSGVVFAYLAQPAYDPGGRVHTFCHAIPGAWHVMGVTQGAGLSLQWYRNRFAHLSDYDELTADASLSPPGARGLFWLPYLMGERTPHLDANARAAWIGLTNKHQASDLIRSIFEGVCYSLKDALEIIKGLGASPVVTRLSGGGARSPLWHQLFADIFDGRVTTLETHEGSAFGAALLAAVGTDHFATAREASRAAVHEVSVRDPDPESVAFYRKRYRVFCSLYPALKLTFGAIAELDS